MIKTEIKEVISHGLKILSNGKMYEECQLLEDLFATNDIDMCSALGVCIFMLQSKDDSESKANALFLYFEILKKLKKRIDDEKETIANLQMALLNNNKNERV